VKEHHGMFEQAQGGTLFLDEVGEMPLNLQAKLLRILQERQIIRLGGDRIIDIDVRVVVATNKDLRAAIVAREFREDLYFRISTFKLRVPALRERPGDILPLVARLLARHAPADRVLSVNAQAQAALQAYSWPGNVRELENVVLRSLVMCSDNTITLDHLMFDEAPTPALRAAEVATPVQAIAAAAPSPERLFAEPLPEPAPAGAFWPAATPAASLNTEDGASLQEAVKSNEHQLIMAAIQTTFSRMEAAHKLGISPRTLRYKLAKLKVNSPGAGMALAND
jgi:two-component system response regulator FlrC